MRDRIRYVGLDVHKEAIVVAIAEDGIRGAAGEYGRIANTATALDRLMRKLADGGARLRFCYEDGGHSGAPVQVPLTRRILPARRCTVASTGGPCDVLHRHRCFDKRERALHLGR